MSEAKKIALTLVVIVLMTFGIYVGFAQSSPTLTPGFGASGSWGCPGGGPVVVVPPPVVPPPVVIVPVVPPVAIVNPFPVNPPVTSPVPAPNFGASGDWGFSSPQQ